jgi:alkanesulfonate monooxygenase SsuD/methylene tetrahydromethanopterin reductase-like flavin-dependent oxidoreductase (luciferase family)
LASQKKDIRPHEANGHERFLLRPAGRPPRFLASSEGAFAREVYDLSYFQSLAAAAETAKLDAIFVADHVGMWDTYESNIAHYANPRLEPITLLSALSAVTSQVGLLATASASYTEPYNLARMFASLDHLSHGRAGWNVVTSSMPEEAMNFGLDGNIDHGNRYERAAEYLDVVKALWDSVEDKAILLNRGIGFFADPQRIHRINHASKYLKVRGPLNVPRPLQGHPVSSRPARRMTARTSPQSMSTSILPSCAPSRWVGAIVPTSIHASSLQAGSRKTSRSCPASIPSLGIAGRGKGKRGFPADARP